jgi:hypothetical protein
MTLLFDCATKLPSVSREDFHDLGVARQTRSARYPLINVFPAEPELGQYRCENGTYEICCEVGERYEVKFKSPNGVFTIYLQAEE